MSSKQGVGLLDPAFGKYLAATEEQLPNDGWMEYEYWKRGALVNRERFFVTPKRFDKEGHRVF